ncbi:FUSC family protein [Vibrio sp. CAIM 722]|uniref:FUSC family protein n=1 Tax=Vibrio eleionomae TaxID=2653505 RepID=A0A7X4RV79_9VIBR|nr:FUSC family protein [Vibrio eleionomae]MZI94253.1 FUSC family protein [Vibrio eleionomae]
MRILFNAIFFPDIKAVKFAVKGVIAMALSLYIAMFFNLDRPYWAMIGAIFLQIRPESGLVIEKGLCQIVGTLVGGIFAIFVLQLFSAYPELAIGSLALWLGINSALSALVRRQNLVYAFAMAGMTACLVVLLVMIQPSKTNSAYIFAIAQARMSEIIIGVICAALVSTMIWPVRVRDALQVHARSVINQTLQYFTLELDPAGSHDDRHQSIDGILESLTALNDDSSAVAYEGPDGPGQSRAATLLSNKTLSLLALIQIFGRLQRKHDELVSDNLKNLLDEMRETFNAMEKSQDYHECYEMAQKLRRRQIYYANNSVAKTAFEARIHKIALELSAELIMVLKGYNSITTSKPILLNAIRIMSHRDPLVGLTTGVRSAIMFLVGAGLWIGTGATAVLMIMILPVVFSVMMARLPMMILTIVMKRILVGILIALPMALFFALPLLAESSGDFEILILVLAGPYFISLLPLANRPTLPYALGMSIPFTIFVMPSTNMTRSFSIDYTVSYAMAIFVGVTILLWLFKLITGPSLNLMMNRLMRDTYNDLIQVPHHKLGETWFNARMGDRLLRISTYEKGMSKNRDMTDLGLTALNLGHVSLRLRQVIKSSCDSRMDGELEHWQQALADAFMSCYRGQGTSSFSDACHRILERLSKENLPHDKYDLIRGSFERMSLTFERTSATIAENRALAVEQSV